MIRSRQKHMSGALPVMNIRTRLTLWYSSLLATVIVVFAISLFSVLNWTWRYQISENMMFVANQTLQSLAIDPASGHIDVQTPEAFDMSTYPYLIQVRQTDGQLVQTSDNVTKSTQPFDQEALKVTDVTTHDVYPDKRHALVMTAPIYTKDQKIVGTVQILSLMANFDAAVERLFRIMLGVGLVALLLAFMVGSVIAGQALQPIDTISQAAK